jgi:ferredoxin
VTKLLEPVLDLGTPLTSPFLALAVSLLVAAAVRRQWRGRRIALAIGLTVAAFWLAYTWAARWPAVGKWLAALDSPLFTVYLLVVLPAMTLPRNRWYRVFLALPAALLVLAVFAVIDAYRAVPAGKGGFYWLLIRPAYLMGGAASLLVLLEPLLSLRRFRFAVRLAAFLALMYGGLALRQDYRDFQAAMDRRFDPRNPPRGVASLTDTRPVLQSDRRMTYLPAAPCRFSADGGYVQGCNLEWAQRLLQLEEGKLARRDPAAISAFAILFGALGMFVMLSFLAGRAMCGWLCPLSALGGALDWLRRRLRLPHVKPGPKVKLAYYFSGAGVASIALAMAKAYPHLDANGAFLGCKIPLYPFCKVCPSQPICSVVGRGSYQYAPLPDWELGFGFFTTLYVALLVLFGASFAAGRRLWCRFCPMGMISGPFNRGGMFALRKDALKCNRCGVCAEVCPMAIDRVRSEMDNGEVSSYHCVLCLRCVEHCPRDGCLSLEHAGVKVAESKFNAG